MARSGHVLDSLRCSVCHKAQYGVLERLRPFNHLESRKKVPVKRCQLRFAKNLSSGRGVDLEPAREVFFYHYIRLMIASVTRFAARTLSVADYRLNLARCNSLSKSGLLS